jgi:hypothetical protein
MFESMSKLDYTLDDFIIYMEHIDNYNLKINLSSSGSEMNSVKIMNIHKSKGLEFNIIYFTGLYKNFNRHDLKCEFGVSELYGVYFPQKDPIPFHIVQELNTIHEARQDTSEKIRLFYVALTRTREKMIFVTSSSEYDFHMQKLAFEMAYKYLPDLISRKENGEDVFEDAFMLFKEDKINFLSLYIITQKLNYDLPYDFWLLPLEEKKQYTFTRLLEEIDIDYINMIKRYASENKSFVAGNSGRRKHCFCRCRNYRSRT